ncbi:MULTISPECIES: hypothetical protein [Bacillaceae]|uniref:hypothetical protein n=1 Tax=Bacillaceae TaxID=186817 RepID=UPI001457380C|nr:MULTISPECIES: hypothetical protein [Bacillaceae]NLP52063.1 hypothetical protein [Bacillus sp. RO1]UAL49821.1 hypothetical protein K7887_22135 [Sutcliffiella horikoshii]
MFGLTKQEKQLINELKIELINSNSQREVKAIANEIHSILNRAERRVATIKTAPIKFTGRQIIKKQQRA